MGDEVYINENWQGIIVGAKTEKKRNGTMEKILILANAKYTNINNNGSSRSVGTESFARELINVNVTQSSIMLY